MPKLSIDSGLLIDLLLIWVVAGFALEPTFQACIPVICLCTLKALSMYLPKQEQLSDKKSQELEDKIAILKKEITATRMRIGLER